MTVTAVLSEDDWVAKIMITGLPVLPAPGDPYPATPWTLSRSDGLTEQPVRGAFERDLVASSAAIVRDREYPISRPFLYVLRYVDAGTGPVTVYSDWIVPTQHELPRISDPITGDGVDVTILTWPEFAREARAQAYDVDGRDFPYVVSAPMSAETSQIILRTLDAAGWRTLLALVRTGQILQIRATIPSIDDAYVLPSRYNRARLSNRGDDVRRLTTLDVVETGQPSPLIVVANLTLQDIADAYAGQTLADIADDYDTLLELSAADL